MSDHDLPTQDSETDEAMSEAHQIEAGDGDLPSTGLLSFYDRLRERIERYVERKGGKVGQTAVDALLLVPDVFIFLVRMALDPDVPRAKRALIGSALVYFVLPIDIMPEAILGAGGFVDDLVLALAVLTQAFGSDLEPYARKYWSGNKALRHVLRDVLQTSHGLLGADLHGRLRTALASRGIDLDEAERTASSDDLEGSDLDDFDDDAFDGHAAPN